jgi:hypothetical protein
MKVEQTHWTAEAGWTGASDLGGSAQLVIIFGGRDALSNNELVKEALNKYPEALAIGCSTAGEIAGTGVFDDSIVATAVQFDTTQIKRADIQVTDSETSTEAGQRLARKLQTEGLKHVFVISDGQHVNGSELVTGLTEVLPKTVRLTGGLAGDGARFEKTLIFADGQPTERAISAIGFYGDQLRVGYGSLGGWDPFGPTRQVTRSEANVLYELDGKPALELYKNYLGEHADGLPATGLLFPLDVRLPDGEDTVVRTILAVDEEQQSLTFAGNIPEGSIAQLMRANFERLIDGASGAAQSTFDSLGESQSPDLAILISCVGRKLVLKQRTEDEVEGVKDILGDDTVLTGFYSYGEICPSSFNADCELHNQTMTVTTFRELQT